MDFDENYNTQYWKCVLQLNSVYDIVVPVISLLAASP